MTLKFSRINNGTEWLLFILSPLLAFPYLVAGVFKGRSGNLLLISLVMAFVGFLFPPFADLYRHTQQYLGFVEHNHDALYFVGMQRDFIMYTMSNLFARWGVPFEYVRFIFVLVSYQVSFFLYRRLLDLKGYADDSTESKWLFWIFFLSVPFIWIVNGLRMATACYVAVLGWYHFYYRRYVLGVFLYLVALALHFGAMMFVPLFLAVFLPAIPFSRQSIIIASAVILALGGILLKMLPPGLIEDMNMEKTVNYYMVNSQKNFTDTLSVNGFIAQWLERAMLVYIYLRLVLDRNGMDTKDMTIVTLCFFAWILTYPFMILHQKLSLFIIPLILFLYLKNTCELRLVKHVALCCLISFLAYAYGYRGPLLHTPLYKLLISPAYVMATADTRATFKDSKVSY